MFRRRANTTMAPPIEVAATGKYPTSGHDVSAGWKKTGNPSKGIVSVEDINKRSEKYITEMKKRFLG
ncbi:hypothetical protein PAHAL_3G114100 [Panicum hallii]|uniref:Uncharacterized protein n=1 Tax=Panicum hallii TaxID=206008 RepID=A0A2S3H817_9POAL|nr:hypothetical protein PAHAL_3G114100 [Panicum hallii]